jgi:hypothetical protein
MVLLAGSALLLTPSTVEPASDLPLRIAQGEQRTLPLKLRPEVIVSDPKKHSAAYRLIDRQGNEADFLNTARIGLRGQVGGECQLVVDGIQPGSFVIEFTDKSTHLIQPTPDAPLVRKVPVEVYGIEIISDPVNLNSAPLPVGTTVTLTAHVVPSSLLPPSEIRWAVRSPSEELKHHTGPRISLSLDTEGTYEMTVSLIASEIIGVPERKLEIRAARNGAYIRVSQGGRPARVVGQDPKGVTLLTAELVYSKDAFSSAEIQWEVMEPDPITREAASEWMADIYSWLQRVAFFNHPSGASTDILLTKNAWLKNAKFGTYRLRATLCDRTVPGSGVQAITLFNYVPFGDSEFAELMRRPLEQAFFDFTEDQNGKALEIWPRESYTVETDKSYQVKLTYVQEASFSLSVPMLGATLESKLTQRLTNAYERSRTRRVAKKVNFIHDKRNFEDHVDQKRENYGCFSDRQDWENYLMVIKHEVPAQMVLYELVDVHSDGRVTPSSPDQRILVLVPPPLADRWEPKLWPIYKFRKRP